MTKRIKTIERKINGIAVYQRENDGYVNATQICKIHQQLTREQKLPADWLRSKAAERAIAKLSTVMGIPITDLVDVKSGGKYQGTWIHPRLAVRFTMWVNDDFSLLVEDWVHEWFESGKTPAKLEADIDRVSVRDELKDSRRVALTEQVKFFLEAAGAYNPNSKETQMFFGRVHNEINILLTTEKALDMRTRLEKYLGKKVSDKELLRDYYPIIDLANFAAVCQAAANNMGNGMHPVNAVRMAVKQVMPSDYQPKPIDFTERIGIVRNRVEQTRNRGLLPE